MAEYLSKETLQEKLNRKKAGPDNKRYTEGWNDAILMVKSMIHSENAADVAPVRHAKVIDKISDDHETIKPWDYRYYCSACKIAMRDSWNKYCPNCGAKMMEG